MIKEIKIRNYKSHKKTDLALKPISVFIGKNNGGKSGILQILQLLKQSIKSSDPSILIPEKSSNRTVQRQINQPVQYSYPNLSIDVGNFSDVVSKDENRITVGLKADVAPISIAMKRRGIEKIDVEYEIAFNNNNIFSHQGKLIAGEHSIQWTFNSIQGGRTIFPSNILIEGISCDFMCSPNIYQPIQLHTFNVVPPNTSSDIQAEVRDFFNSLSQALQNLFNSFFIVSGIRGFEERSYHLADGATDMELILLEDRSIAVSSSLPFNRTLENKLSVWLEKFLGVGIEFELEKQTKLVKIRAKKGNKSGLFIGEGLGIHQLAFLFFPIAQAQLRTICIEEPEVHLHPEAQTQLTSHLIRIYKEENKQYIIPTHSEHVLFGFLNAVARKEISKDELGIYFFDKKEEATEVTPLTIDEQGRIPGGLPGFFDHSVKNLIDYIESIEK